MSKYTNRNYMYPSQEAEIFPILDSALALPFGKALIHKCSQPRANYLSRILNGERYRNGILSISTYSPNEPLYGKGLYYHLVIETTTKGLIVANVENPVPTITDQITQCAAFHQPVTFTCSFNTATNRLTRLIERYPTELNSVYADRDASQFVYAIPKYEEMIIVDVDVNRAHVPDPTEEQMAKQRANQK